MIVVDYVNGINDMVVYDNVIIGVSMSIWELARLFQARIRIMKDPVVHARNDELSLKKETD